MKHRISTIIAGLALFCACAAAQEKAVNAPYAGATVSDFKGKVSVQLPAQAFSAPVRGELLPPDTTVSTDEGRLLLKLADGSDVLVRPHTKLVLKQPETSGWKYIQMTVGRIRTNIQKRMGGKPGFQIGTPSAVISVRGTKFDVEVDRRGFTEVDVDEGVVELESLNGLGESVMITAGFSSRAGMETGPETPRPTRDLRPLLDRPGRHDLKNSNDDDDPVKHLLASDHDRHDDGGDHHGGGDSSGGSGGSGDHSGSGSDSGDHSGSGSSDGGSSGSSGSDDRSGSGDHHGGSKPPEF
ncbi:MAG TPA: FecR family protein [Candidatus Angelobacter sp.]|nr:FecR family protein [Candidatus Angelobacter sp.]